MNLSSQARLLNHVEFRSLVEHSRSPCISLLLAAEHSGGEPGQLRSRIKNMIDLADDKLRSRNVSAAEIVHLLAPLQALPLDSGHRHRDGLAIYRSPATFRWYDLPLRLKEQCVVADRFYVKPLLPLLHCGGRFFLLALSQDSARLFEATRESIHELRLPEIPRDAVDRREEGLARHSRGHAARAASDEAILHGHGSAEDLTRQTVLSFFKRVNDAVTSILAGEDAPLVLACVGYLAPIYEQANSYARLMNAKVPGSPKMWTDDELRVHAWKLVESHFARQRRASVDAVQRAAATGHAITDIRDAVRAAEQGRIDKLLLVEGRQQRGPIDRQRQAAHVTGLDDESVDLLDLAATQTLNHGGTVFVVDEIPGAESALAGLTRY